MPYAFIQDVPANEKIYDQIRARLGDEPPKGMVAHLAMKQDRGLRYVDVWETRDDWERFRVDRLEPIVGEVLASHGLPHDHTLVHTEDIDVIDTWLGGAPD